MNKPIAERHGLKTVFDTLKLRNGSFVWQCANNVENEHHQWHQKTQYSSCKLITGNINDCGDNQKNFRQPRGLSAEVFNE